MLIKSGEKKKIGQKSIKTVSTQFQSKLDRRSEINIDLFCLKFDKKLIKIEYSKNSIETNFIKNYQKSIIIKNR